MNLNETDIRNAFLKYMDESGKKGYKMAELCGMSSPSMFSQYMSGKTQELKAAYLLSFIYNTKIDLEKFLNKNIRENTKTLNQDELESLEPDGNEPEVKICTNPLCKKEIEYLKDIISQKDESLMLYRKLVKKEASTENSAQVG